MSYLIVILSLLQPIYALPLAISQSVKKSTGSIATFCLALTLATITFTIDPTPNYDLYRHYERIINLREIPLAEVWSFSRPGYRLFDYYAWLINYLNLPKEVFSSSIIFLSYSLLLSIFNDAKAKYLQNTNSFYILLILIALFCKQDLISLSSGLRNPFANILVFYFSYNLITYRKLLPFVIGSIIAFFIHPFAIVLSIIVYISYKCSWWSFSSKFLIIIAAILTVSSKIVNSIIQYLLSILANISFFSTDYLSEGGKIDTEDLEARGLAAAFIILVLPRLPIYLAFIYLLKVKPKSNNALYLLLSIMTLYLGLFHSFSTVYNRMGTFYLFIFSLFLCIQVSNSKSKFDKYFLALYAGLIVSYFLGMLYTRRYYVFSDPVWLYKPLLFIFFDV